jgi:plasmid stabilization system protein ParE
LRFQVARQAASQVSEATKWLWENVDDEAANRLEDEIAEAIERLLRHPSLGPPALNAGVPGVRRILLRTMPYHLYYSVNEEQALLTVLAIWHTRRGGRPAV